MTVAVRTLPLLECEVVTDFAHLESIAYEWDNLWAASTGSEVFQSFGWMRAAWRTFGDELRVFTPVIYRGAELIGILPLVLRGQSLESMGSTLADYNDVICADESAVEVVSAAIESLLRAKKQWKTCVLENVAAHSRLARALPALHPALKRHVQSAFRCPCSTILIDENVIAGLIRKQSLRRHENSFRRLGEMSFRHIEDRETIARHLGSFFHQHIGRRAVLGDTSHFMEERTRRMFETLVEELDPRSVLRFGVLSLDERPVAYHFGFEANGKFIFYQTAFDIDYSRSAPGEVMLRQLFRYAQEKRLTEFDLTRGGETYKDRFATDTRKNLTLSLYHDSGLRRRLQLEVQRTDGGMRKSLEAIRKYKPAYQLARQTALKWLRFWRGERQLLQLGAASYSANALRRAFRYCIFSSDTVVTFLIDKDEARSYAEALGDEFSVMPTSLSELAAIAVRNPKSLSFAECQSRLKSGKKAYLIRRGSAPVETWYASNENGVLVLEHCWTGPGFSGSGLKGIVQQSSCEGRDVMVLCRERTAISEELRGLGFRSPNRKIQLRLLHWFKPTFIFRGDNAGSTHHHRNPVV